MTKRKPRPKYDWPFVGADQPRGFMYPLDCSILAVDPGTESGWCIWSRGRIRAYGHFNIFGDLHAIDQAFDALLALPGPHVLVVERPFGAKFGTASSSTGAGDRTWRERARLRGLRRHVRVFPGTWRSKTLPPGWNPAGKKGQGERVNVREMEQQAALAELGNEPFLTLHPDVAPALLIGKWASYAGEVNAKLPKKHQRKVA